MVILRCTSKLQKRLCIKAMPTDLVSSGKLGDWSCNLVYLGKTQTVLCVNHLTRLPIFVAAADGKQFPARLQATLGTVLAELGVAPHLIARECGQFEEITFAKTNDRSVTGSMNDFVRLSAWYEVTAEPNALITLSLKLTEVPCTPLNFNSPGKEVQQLLTEEQN